MGHTNRWLLCAALLLGSAPVYAQGDPWGVLGFEDASAWALLGGAGTIVGVAPLSDGDGAVETSGPGWRRIQSDSFVLESTGTILSLDVSVDSDTSGWETVGVALELPAAQLWWADLGVHPLPALSAGAVRHLEFALPGDVRDAINAHHSLRVNVIFNGPQLATFDALSIGAAQVPSPPAPPPDPPYVGNLCQDENLRVTDIDADFADIWAGRETAETGKRTDPLPTVALEFNAPIDPGRLPAVLVGNVNGERDAPMNCDGSEPTTLHRVRLRPVSGAEAWQSPIIGSADEMRAPLDFNVFVLGDLSGMPDSGGPVAASGNASLQGFSVNGAPTHEIGLVVGGELTAANGTIHGDVAVGVAEPCRRGRDHQRDDVRW